MAVFVEPLGLNPLINLYRRLTPTMRTSDEHPLLPSDLALITQRFGHVEVHYYYLLTLIIAVLPNMPGLNLLRRAFEALDSCLFRVPWLRERAWQVLIVLSNPTDT